MNLNEEEIDDLNSKFFKILMSIGVLNEARKEAKDSVKRKMGPV